MTESSRNNYCIPTTSRWVGEELCEQGFAWGPPQYTEEASTYRSMSGDDYCAFMGMYLSEGHLQGEKGTEEKNYIRITQKEYSKGFSPFRDLLTRILGRVPYYGHSVFNFGWRGLARHLEQFGTNCYSKTIPQAILNATPRQQKIFWDFYLLGDGAKRASTGQEHIATTSKVMADQLQELAQKMGYAATICKVDTSKYTDCIEGREINATCPRYDVYLKTSPRHSVDIEKTTYKGKIGCVTVANHTLYVRRGGKAAWCGNTKNGIPNGMLVFKGLGFTPRELDLITRMWNNLKKGITKQWALPAMALPPNTELELVDFSSAKDKDALFQEHINLVIAIYCTICGLSPKRLGFRISGKIPEAKPDPEMKQAAASAFNEEDAGLTDYLETIENMINSYILWTRFPALKFVFRGKTPREDAREYEVRALAQTYAERRAEVDLKPLTEMIENKEHKELAQLMDIAPCDPGMAGIWQTLCSTYLKSKMDPGGEEPGKEPGAPFKGSTDGAKKEQHGTTAGTRRPASSSDENKAKK